MNAKVNRGKPAINLIMPMAGRGQRFLSEGYTCPKPMIDLAGKPFFWWAAESIFREFQVQRFVCVVRSEHITEFGIAEYITQFYPDAEIVSLSEVTKGPLETALRGLKNIDDHTPVIINDCDHAFDAEALAQATASESELPAGFLSHFRSSAPVYSYAEYDAAGKLCRTAEKIVISDLAIAGAYWLRSPTFLHHCAPRYTRERTDNELFLSGIYNHMAAAGENIRGVMLKKHIPFGTHSEYKMACAAISEFTHWAS